MGGICQRSTTAFTLWKLTKPFQWPSSATASAFQGTSEWLKTQAVSICVLCSWGIHCSVLEATWTKLGAECYGIKTCVDVTLAPAASMLWYRTTLVKRSGRWQLHEHNRFVTDEYAASSLTTSLPNPGSVQEVITIRHTKECTHEQLGFSVVEEALDLLGPLSGSSSSSAAPQPVVAAPALEQFDAPAFEQADEAMNLPLQVMPPVDVPGPFEAPVAPDEPDPPDEVLAGADEIVLDGTRIDSTSSLAVLRAACSSLGISVNGSRAQLFKRLVQHLQQQELLAAHSVKHNLGKELQRSANQPGIPAQPTEEEVLEHNVTHIPFKSWCELCVAHKGRQDKHHRESHLQSEHSLVSFDFGYVDCGTDDPLTVLFIHDRSTKMMHAVPTAAKGGKSLPYLTQELCRFVTWLGHQEVWFRTDNEPSTVSLLDACRKALKGLGVHTTVELVVPGNKEANGAAEVTVQTLRNQANLSIEQVERSVGADGKVLFSALHPLYSWAIIHAGWLHCRFAVNNGETAYERCTGKEYHGKACYFGETCMGYLKPTAKGLPSWHRGVWLGKTQNNDAHIISCNGGLFITRSVRRITSPWILPEVGNVEMSPWECSFATLGSRLMVPKRVLKPTAQVVPALPPASIQPGAGKLEPVLDVEAEAVRGLPPIPIESADEPASKKARICVVAGVEYEHEDDHNYTSFTSDELDSLEEFDFGLTSDDGDEPASEDVLVQQLIFPYTEHEPQLSTDQLKHVDAIAMEVETARLKQMGVLLPPESVEGMNPKRLSTRYVITWRDKVLNGMRCWLRRARYVAREYAWLSPERQDLFCPASSNITNRLLPSVFLHWKMKHPEKQCVMCAIDIGDAFLTVEQKQPTIVSSRQRPLLWDVCSLGKEMAVNFGLGAWVDSSMRSLALSTAVHTPACCTVHVVNVWFYCTWATCCGDRTAVLWWKTSSSPQWKIQDLSALHETAWGYLRVFEVYPCACWWCDDPHSAESTSLWQVVWSCWGSEYNEPKESTLPWDDDRGRWHSIAPSREGISIQVSCGHFALPFDRPCRVLIHHQGIGAVYECTNRKKLDNDETFVFVPTFSTWLFLASADESEWPVAFTTRWQWSGDWTVFCFRLGSSQGTQKISQCWNSLFPRLSFAFHEPYPACDCPELCRGRDSCCSVYNMRWFAFACLLGVLHWMQSQVEANFGQQCS